MAKGQDEGIVLRAWAGTCCCLVKDQNGEQERGGVNGSR
jgi:hypothetical protein